MPSTKENYQITATDPNGLLLRLNSVLSRISDRLDKLEGFRGELETASGTFKGGVFVDDPNSNRIHSME